MNKRSDRLFLIVLILACIVSIWAAFLPTNAQEATDTPEPQADSPVGEFQPVPDDGIVIEADNPAPDANEALAPMLAMGAAIMMAMETFIKPTLKSFIADTKSQGYAIAAHLLAFILALILVFGTNSTANLFSALGIFDKTPLWLAQITTALAVSFGNVFLHAVYDFFAKARLPTARG